MRVYCDKIAEVRIVYCDKMTGPSVRRECIVTKWLKSMRLAVTELDHLCAYCDKTTEVRFTIVLQSVRCKCIVTKWLKPGSRIAKKTTDMSSVRLSDASVLRQNSSS